MKFTPSAPRPVGAESLKTRFLALLAQSASVQDAAAELGSTVNVFFGLRAADKDFAKAWDETARNAATAYLEAKAFERAINGSDSLLMFLLKSYDRKTFDDKLQQHNQDSGAVFKLIDVSKDKKKV